MNKIKNFEKIIQYAPDPMVIVNEEGTILYVNQQTEITFGYKTKELHGKPIETLIPERFYKTHKHHLQSFFTSPQPRPMNSGNELRGLKKDGSEFTIDISLSPLVQEGLVVAAIRDTSEKHMNTQLLNKTKQLEDFAYITSHNLRSSVSNLNSLIEFYKAEFIEEEKNNLFNKFELTVHKLSETLNILMDVLIVQQNSNATKDHLDFESVCAKVRSNLEFYIIKSNARIHTNFQAAPSIDFPKIYLESILQNLLSNALKYASPARQPVIMIKTLLVKDKIHLTFSDNGLGIDLQKYGSKIFGLNKVFHGNQDAKGVGLFITKTQIEAMGGSISVSSIVNEGSTFTVIF